MTERNRDKAVEGLTKREEAAIAYGIAIIKVVGKGGLTDVLRLTPASTANAAVAYADALFDALDGDGPKPVPDPVGDEAPDPPAASGTLPTPTVEAKIGADLEWADSDIPGETAFYTIFPNGERVDLVRDSRGWWVARTGDRTIAEGYTSQVAMGQVQVIANNRFSPDYDED